MKEYHKIQSTYKREPKTKKFIIGQYSRPEFELLRNIQWEWTEKVNGTNIRLIYEREKPLVIKGKTENADIPAVIINFVNEHFNERPGVFEQTFNVKEDIENFSICLYGEGIGPKIQKGGKYRKDHSIVLFDVKIGRWWLKRDAVERIGFQLGLDIVPVVGYGTLDEAIELVKSGFRSDWGDFIAEGLVLRPKEELFDRKGERIITKIKHVDFL